MKKSVEIKIIALCTLFDLWCNGSESTFYEINISEETENVVTAYKEYEDSSYNTSKTPTLIITFGDYTLNFRAK